MKSWSLRNILIFCTICMVLQFGIRYFFFSGTSPGFHFINPPNTPHLDTLNLDIAQVKWFRIWYSTGHKENEFGDKYGYYAVSGNNNKMKKCGIYEELKIILDSLSQMQYSFTDFSSKFSFPSGSPEYMSIRLKFKNKPYSTLGEFQLYTCFSEDSPNSNRQADYIMLFHSESTRYMIEKRSHPELSKLLEELAYSEYGKCMEFREM